MESDALIRQTAKVQQRFQYAAAYGQSLVRSGHAVGGIAAGIHISALHAGKNGQTFVKQAPQASVDGADHGDAVYRSGNIPGVNQLPNFHFRVKNACRRGAKDTQGALATNDAGNAGIGQGAAGIEDTAQCVSPHGLHSGVAVHAGGKAGADGGP